MEKLLKYLAQHSVQAHGSGDSIQVLSLFTINGVLGSEWVTIPATWKSVRDFLGY